MTPSPTGRQFTHKPLICQKPLFCKGFANSTATFFCYVAGMTEPNPKSLLISAMRWPSDSERSTDSSRGVRLAPLPSRPATERTNCHEAGVLHVLHVESNGNSRRLVRTPTLY